MIPISIPIYTLCNICMYVLFIKFNSVGNREKIIPPLYYKAEKKYCTCGKKNCFRNKFSREMKNKNK